jgi:hypothetical protein
VAKRFAFSAFDRDLASCVIGAEGQLISSCSSLQIPCRSLLPAVIYGKVGQYGDRNMSRLLQLMRRLPLLPLSAQLDLRQPIQASLLAAPAFHLAFQLTGPGLDPVLPNESNNVATLPLAMKP